MYYYIIIFRLFQLICYDISFKSNKRHKSKNTLNKGSYHIAEIFEHFSSHRISLKNQMK